MRLADTSQGGVLFLKGNIMPFRTQASIDPNKHKGLILLNSITANPLVATGLSLTNAQPMHVAIVDGDGSQVTSFGGGTQYTDGGTPPANPVGPTLEWNEGGTWRTVSSAKPLPVTATASTPSTIFGFVTTVSSAGTRVQLASNTLTNGAILQAPSTNTGLIYVGVVTVSSTVYGAELQPGQAVSFAGNNSNLIYIDASVSGDKCACLGS